MDPFVAQQSKDFILFDMGQSTDPLSISVLDQSERIFVVTELAVACGRPGRRMIDILRALHYLPGGKIQLVLTARAVLLRKCRARPWRGNTWRKGGIHAARTTLLQEER
ncbi:hypothetical protein ACTMU2_24235 [Cupriavidus basilensis]